MGKIKANNYEVAKNELSVLGGDLLSKIDFNIDERESNMYHVIGVKIVVNQNSVSNEVKITKLKFHEQNFIAVDERKSTLDINKMIVIHNPNKKVEEVEVKEEVEVEGSTDSETKEEFEIAKSGTNEDLIQFAKDKGIDLGSLRKKADIINAIEEKLN